jgi:autotransporter-associated beta strand protein
MAFFYMDRNAATLGFGPLTANVSTPLLINVTSAVLGDITTTTAAYSSANQHELAFGSPDTSQNTTPGILTVDTAVNAWFKGITYQNLAGTQTINAAGTGRIGFVGTGAYVNVTANGRLVITCPIQGTVNWEKRGSSILRLTAVNVFSAGMSIAAGTVEIGNASALGTGTVTMTGGKLSSSSTTGYSLANALTLNGTMTLGDATNTGALTFSGTTTISGTTSVNTVVTTTLSGSFTGSAALSMTTGAGAFFLTGATGNTYSGALTIAGANVYLASGILGTPNQVNTASSITISSGSLNYLGGTALSQSTIQAVSGAGTLRIFNNGGVTFNGNMNTPGFTGDFETFSDNATGNTTPTVIFASASAYPASASNITAQSVNSGATTHTRTYSGASNIQTTVTYWGHYAYNAAFTALFRHYGSTGTTFTIGGLGPWISNDNAFDVTLQYDVASGNTLNITVPFKEFSTGKFLLTKLGTGTLTLSGDNQISKTITVSAGTLNANSATALGSASSTAAISVTSGATLSLGAAATYTLRTLTVSGTGSSNAPNNGALIVNNTGTSTFGGIQLTGPTYIRATNNGLINAPFTPANNSVIFGASAGSDFTPFASLSNVFSGTGSVTYGGHSGDTGIVRADVRHTYTGNTTMAFGTTSVASAQELPATGGPLGNKSLTAANTLLMTGGTLSYLDGNVDYSGRFSTAGGQQWRISAGTATTFATALVGASSLSLLGGALTLTGSSTFSSGVTLASGTLNAGSAEITTGLGVSISGPLGLTGAIAFTGGTLQYSSVNQFDYSFRFSTAAGQSFKIDTNGQDVTFSSVLTSAGGSLAKSGTGKLTLGVANSYSNGSTLTNGTLKCNNAASLGAGGLAQANGTTLHVATVDGKMTIQGAHTNTGSGSRIIRIGA